MGGTIKLPPEPSSVSQARRWIRETLEGWPEDACTTAQFLLSELVTNVVMHARTPMLVSATFPSPEVLRCEVEDTHRTPPTVKRHHTDAATGRGLRLLDAMARRWGAEATAQSKRVWFEISLGAQDSVPVEPEPEPPTALAVTPDHLAATDGSGSRRVRILALPVAAYREAEEHNDAVLRELQLLVHHAPTGDHHGAPQRLLDLAREVSAVFSRATDRLRAQVEAAEQRGSSTVDIEVDVPLLGWEVLITLADRLDELDEFGASGTLITLASPPSVRRFRTWYTEQVANQMRGAAPTPWPFDPPDFGA
jgi:hypothetical protein